MGPFKMPEQITETIRMENGSSIKVTDNSKRGGSPVDTPAESRLVEPHKSLHRGGAHMPRKGEYPDDASPTKAKSPPEPGRGQLSKPPASLPVRCPHCQDPILQVEEYCTACHDYCCMECQDSDGKGPCCQINLGDAA